MRLEPDAPIINPDVVDRTRRVGPEDIRPGYSVALDCAASGKRHSARRVTTRSTEGEAELQRASAKAGRAAPPRL